MNYSELAKDAPWCFGCGSDNDGTVVLAHRNRSGWGLKFGKGIKSLQLSGAFLCHSCHQYGDGGGRTDHSWWELSTQRSQTWAWEQGFLRLDPAGGDPDKRLR